MEKLTLALHCGCVIEVSDYTRGSILKYDYIDVGSLSQAWVERLCDYMGVIWCKVCIRKRRGCLMFLSLQSDETVKIGLEGCKELQLYVDWGHDKFRGACDRD